MAYSLIRHLHIIHFSLTKQLSETYICVLLRYFALSMIGLFIPIYFFKELGYGLSEIMIFYMVLFAVSGAVTPTVAKIISKTGCNHAILISVPFTLVFYIFLDMLKSVDFLFYFAAVLGGISEALYWIAFHVDFTKFSDAKHRGEEITTWYVLAFAVGIISPLIGALVLTFLGFNVLFVMVSMFLVLSALPLLSTKEVFSKDTLSAKYIFSRQRIKDSVAYIAYGARGIGEGIFWPFFMFFIVHEYFSIGLAFSVASVFNAVVAWLFIGRGIDKYGMKKFLNIGVFFDSIILILRIFPKNFLHVLGLTVFGSAAYDVTDVAVSAKMYNKAKKDPLGYMAFRWLFSNVGRVLILAVPLIASYYVDKFTVYDALKYGFVALAGVVYLQKLVFSRNKEITGMKK